jgi:hypothetical protein
VQQLLYAAVHLVLYVLPVTALLFMTAYADPHSTTTTNIHILSRAEQTQQEHVSHKLAVYRVTSLKHIAVCQYLSSFVTMNTRSVWSSDVKQHSPALSGLQSKLTIGCVLMTREFSSSAVPATPAGC